MLIDPFTVIAQIVNFLVLVVALKLLLFDRVVRAMDERERRIAARLEEADERAAAADREAERLRRAQADLERDRDELVAAARADAEERRRDLLDRARAEVDEQRSRWCRSLDAERAEVALELRRRTSRQVVDLGRRALIDLADADLERRVVEVALARLRDDEAAREVLGDADGGPLTVRTGFALGDGATEEVERCLRRLGGGREVRFEVDPGLVIGLEVRGDGAAVSWNASDYLERLDEAVDEVLGAVPAPTEPEGAGP